MERYSITGSRVVSMIRKKVGNTVYVHDSASYCDKDLKQPRSKPELIGKVDPVTGETVPTGKRGRKARSPEESSASAVIVRINAPDQALAADRSEETTDFDMRYTELNKTGGEKLLRIVARERHNERPCLKPEAVP